MSGDDPMRCGADTRSGSPCKQIAGARTNHKGDGRCWLHGGASPQAEVSGAVRLARREAAVMGAPIDGLQPEEALLECIRIVGGEVVYASERIAELDPGEAVGAVVTTRPLKKEKGAESLTERVEEHGPPAVHIWIEVRHQAMDRLANYSKIAIAAGLAQRQVKVAEEQGALLAEAVRGILKDLGADKDPHAPEVVRRHLTLVAGRVRELAA